MIMCSSKRNHSTDPQPDEIWSGIGKYILERLDGIDRELTVAEAAIVRGVSPSLMRKRIALVPAWREAFFASGTSKEMRTTIRRLRQAEDKLAGQATSPRKSTTS